MFQESMKAYTRRASYWFAFLSENLLFTCVSLQMPYISTIRRQGFPLAYATKSSIKHIFSRHTSIAKFESQKKSVFTIPNHLILSLIDGCADIGTIASDPQTGRMSLQIHTPFSLGLSVDGSDARVIQICSEWNGAFLQFKTAFPVACVSCECFSVA